MKKKIEQLRTFLDEVKVELKKCAWPTRGELYQSTIVVVVSVVVLATYVGLCDTLFVWVLSLVFG